MDPEFLKYLQKWDAMKAQMQQDAEQNPGIPPPHAIGSIVRDRPGPGEGQPNESPRLLGD